MLEVGKMLEVWKMLKVGKMLKVWKMLEVGKMLKVGNRVRVELRTRRLKKRYDAQMIFYQLRCAQTIFLSKYKGLTLTCVDAASDH
jgi:hypothetical protein